jgi:hypothetical protein
VDAYLAKPVNMEDLAARLAAADRALLVDDSTLPTIDLDDLAAFRDLAGGNVRPAGGAGAHQHVERAQNACPGAGCAHRVCTRAGGAGTCVWRLNDLDRSARWGTEAFRLSAQTHKQS